MQIMKTMLQKRWGQEKCALSVLLALALVVCSLFVPEVAKADDPPNLQSEVTYSKWVNGTFQPATVNQYTPICTDGSYGTEWSSGTYVVTKTDQDDNFDVSGRITISGEVKLILGKGATLNITDGFEIPASDNGSSTNKLSIYAETTTGDETVGKLTVTADANNAGIEVAAGETGDNAGELEIHGGDITVNGGENGAGIGGGDGKDSGKISIYGGLVKATGGQDAAGIGGGNGGKAAETIAVKGGIVFAYYHAQQSNVAVEPIGSGKDAENSKGKLAHTAGIVDDTGFEASALFAVAKGTVTAGADIQFKSSLRVETGANVTMQGEKTISVLEIETGANVTVKGNMNCSNLKVSGTLECEGRIECSSNNLHCDSGGKIKRKIPVSDSVGSVGDKSVTVEYEKPLPAIASHPTGVNADGAFIGYYSMPYEASASSVPCYYADGTSDKICDDAFLRGIKSLKAERGVLITGKDKTVYVGDEMPEWMELETDMVPENNVDYTVKGLTEGEEDSLVGPRIVGYKKWDGEKWVETDGISEVDLQQPGKYKMVLGGAYFSDQTNKNIGYMYGILTVANKSSGYYSGPAISTSGNADGTQTVTTTYPDGSTTEEIVDESGVVQQTTKRSETRDSFTGDRITTVTVEHKDGTVEKTVTREKADGSREVTFTKENPDGTKEETVTKENTDGSKEVTVTKENTDGAKEITTTQEKSGGEKVVVKETRDKEGKTLTKVTTETKTDAALGITTTTETTEKADGSKVVSTTAEKKDGTKEVTITEIFGDKSSTKKESFAADGSLTERKTTEVSTEPVTGATVTTETTERTGQPKETVVTTRFPNGGTEVSVTKEGVNGASETTVTKEIPGQDKEVTVTKKYTDGTTDVTVTTEKATGTEVTQTIQYPNGSSVTKKEVKDQNGNVLEKTTVEVKPDAEPGTTVTMQTTETADGIVVTETKEKTDGSKEITVTKTNDAGEKETTLTKLNPDGTREEMTSKENPDGTGESESKHYDQDGNVKETIQSKTEIEKKTGDTVTSRNTERSDGSSEKNVTTESQNGDKKVYSETKDSKGNQEFSERKDNHDGTAEGSTVSQDAKGNVTDMQTYQKTKSGETTNKLKVTGKASVEIKKIETTEKELKFREAVSAANGKKYNVTTIGEEAAKGNRNIVNVTMANSIKEVKKGAFENCKKMTDVIFSKKLESIGQKSFRNTAVKNVKVPSSVKLIAKQSFADCKRMVKFVMGERKTGGLNEDGKKAWGAVIKITISGKALENCIRLKEVVINSEVREIGNDAFNKCKALAKIIIYSLVLKIVGKRALKGVNNCKINVPKIRLKSYKILFKNKGQGKKVIVAKI